MNISVLFLSILGVVVLAGCENTQMAQYNPFGQKAVDSQSVENVQMRADTGELTPFPPPSTPSLQQVGNEVANVFNPSLSNENVMLSDTILVGNSPTSPPPVSYNGATMPSFANGMPAATDSSVTIFSLDGDSPTIGYSQVDGQVAEGFDNYSDGVTNQNFVNYDSSGNQIFFKYGSSRLGGGDRRKLSSVAEQAKFAPVNRITVAGYASKPTQAGSNSVEGHILNLKESMNRSFVVSRELMKKGVPAEKIKAVSWGATKPTGNNSQDRRVDIIMGEQ